MKKTVKIGIIGSGFIARGLAISFARHHELSLAKVFTHSNPQTRSDFPFQAALTNSVDELIESSDLIVECSGSVIKSTEILERVFEAGLPVVTMNSELQVTTGSYLSQKGFLTEAEGDQPGCLATLRENAVLMGFSPLVYGNLKGFLNHTPTVEDMQYWSKQNGISLDQVTSFTDGTKVQIEQTLVANAFGASIKQQGLIGLKSDNYEEDAKKLGQIAKEAGTPISDYLLSSKAPAGVFLVAEHDVEQKDFLRYLKMGDGEFYMLMQPFHLCHLEIVKTIRRVINGGSVLLNNSPAPSISVAALTKRKIAKGEKIKRGIGSFDIRGEAVKIAENEHHVPIGLFENVVFKRDVEIGQMINFEDVELEESRAVSAWRETLQKVLPKNTENNSRLKKDYPGIFEMRRKPLKLAWHDELESKFAETIRENNL